MTGTNQQIEKEVYELIGGDFSDNSIISVNVLEAACLILDNKFGKDFHKKNPKLAIRYSETIMKNIRMKDLTNAIQNGIAENLDSIKAAIQQKDFRAKETMLEDYNDLFRFQD